MKGKIFVVIPAYNEEHMITEVIKNLRKAKYRNIIVIDDGSKDNTYATAKKQGVHVLKHVINRGQGASLRTGIEFALRKGAEIIVTFDADGQHRTEDIIKLVDPVQKGKAEIALGSRFLGGSQDIPLLRKIYIKIGIIVILLMYGIKLTDAHNGLRAMSREAAQKIEINTDRMEHASEIPEQIKKKKIRFVEVPVHIRYTDYSKKHGQKSSDAFKIFFKMAMKKLVG